MTPSIFAESPAHKTAADERFQAQKAGDLCEQIADWQRKVDEPEICSLSPAEKTAGKDEFSSHLITKTLTQVELRTRIGDETDLAEGAAEHRRLRHQNDIAKQRRHQSRRRDNDPPPPQSLARGLRGSL